MKNKLVKLFGLFGVILALAACGPINNPTSNPTSEPTSNPTSEPTSTPSTSEKPVFHDYVKESNVRLTLDYKGKDFFRDGVAQVKLRTAIDGDTAHFTQVSDGDQVTPDRIIKARYYGIDTPESTGLVQPWGRPASNFNKEKLKNAEKNGTIVVSTPQDDYGVPQHDSTGVRYVSVIWINETVKNAPLDQLYCLNLWIVQEGLSNVKNVADIPQFKDTFYDAQEQARNFKLNMFSGEDDPLFNYGDYVDVSLLDVKREVEKQMKDPTYRNKFDNCNARVQGTVAGFSNHILYLQSYYPNDPDDPTKGGEYAGINIFTGASSISTKFTTINAYIEVCGNMSDSENFGFQMSGCTWPTRPHNPKDARVVISPEDNTGEFKLHTFNYSQDEFSNMIKEDNYEALYSRVAITDALTVTRAKDGANGITLYFSQKGGLEFSGYVAFPYAGDPEYPFYAWEAKDFEGHEFMVTGVFSTHRWPDGTYQCQICPTNASELVRTDLTTGA